MTDQLALWGLPERVERHCTVCKGSWQQPEGQTYIVQREGLVKIGKSKHVETRFRELHAINRAKYIHCPPTMDRTQPLILLAVFVVDIEHPLHERWARCHVSGEWFLPDRAMRTWLART